MKKPVSIPNVGIRIKKRGADLTGVVIRHTPGKWLEINWDFGMQGPRFCDPREVEILYNVPSTNGSTDTSTDRHE